MLQIEKLSFDYSEKPLLEAINFSVEAGALLHVHGANGAGKTTLLKLLAGLLSPNQGHIFYLGQDIQNDLPTYQQELCYIGHKAGVNSLLTVRENYLLDFKNTNLKSLRTSLTQFGLGDVEDTLCGLLSMGQRRKLGLLRLLTTRAPLWILDEPFVALDQKTVTILLTCFMEHLRNQGSIILTSHQTFSLPIPYQEYAL